MCNLDPTDKQFKLNYSLLQTRLNKLREVLTTPLELSKQTSKNASKSLKGSSVSAACQRSQQTRKPAVPSSDNSVVLKKTGTKVNGPVKQPIDNKQPIVDLIVEYLKNSEMGVNVSDVFKHVIDNLGITPDEFKQKYPRSTFGKFMKNAPENLLNKIGDPKSLFPVAPKGITLPTTYTGCLEMYDTIGNKFKGIVPRDDVETPQTQSQSTTKSSVPSGSSEQTEFELETGDNAKRETVGTVKNTDSWS